MQSFLEFFTEKVEIDDLALFIAHRYLKDWDEFVERGGDHKKFGKLSEPLDSKFNGFMSIVREIGENNNPERYANILNKGYSMKWYKQLQDKAVNKAKNTIINDERQRKNYGMEYMFPHLSKKIHEPILEYRHKDGFGGIKQSLHANNKKGGNITRDPLKRKIPWNVGPYEKIRKAGDVLIGDELLKELGSMGGIEFKDGKEIKRKNSNQILKLFTNLHGQQCGKIVEIKK